MNPPKWPWLKGNQETYSAMVAELHVCRDSMGRVYSSHNLQDQEDHATAMSWPTGGQEQLAFGLLTEAVRREAVLLMLMKLSADREYLQKIKKLPQEEQTLLLQGLSKSLQEQLAKTVQSISIAALQEAMEMFD